MSSGEVAKNMATTKAKKKWQPAPAEAARAFDDGVAQLSGIERRKMFGYSCAFARGNMFAGLHEAGLILRLPDDDRAEFLQLPEAVIFEPWPGRVMREYVVVPPAVLNAPEQLEHWLKRALAFATTLPPKVKKAKKATSSKG